MSLDFVPQPYQGIGFNFLVQTPRGNLYADMGLGKTAMVLSLVKALALDSVLVIAPRRVAQEVWPAEIRKWTQFSDITYADLTGEVDEVRRMQELLAIPTLCTLNYEQIPWLLDTIETWPFKTVVCDESTRLKGFRLVRGKQRATALSFIAHQTDRWINLTGTSCPNGLQDLWGQNWFIDGGEQLGRSYSAFEQRWFYREARAKGSHQKVKPLPHAQEQIQCAMRATTLAIRTKDWFDIAEPVEHEVWVELPPDARVIYKTMEKKFFAEIEGGLVTAANCAVKSNKLLQIASGLVYDANGDARWVHNRKFEALRSITWETAGANLLVVYQYVSELRELLKEFPDARDINEPGVIAAWNKGQVRMLLCHPKSAGHGLNLQDGGHHIVYFTPTWDLELYAQVLERIGPVRQKQSGYDRNVFVYHLMARATMDEVVKQRRERKADLMDSVHEAMKRPA